MSVTEALAGLYRSMETYDGAPKVAAKFFSAARMSPEKAVETFERLYASAKDPVTQQAIGCALNYVLVTDLIRGGNTGEARRIIRTLVLEDVPIGVIDMMVREPFQSSFEQQCLDNSEFLVPSSVDHVVLNTWAPRSSAEVNRYFSEQALVVVSEGPKGKYSYTIGSKSVDTELTGAVGLAPGIFIGFGKKSLASMLGMGRYSGTEESLLAHLRDALNKRGVEKYCVVFANHPGVHEYLQTRYQIKSIGQELKELALQLDLGHGTTTTKS